MTRNELLEKCTNQDNWNMDFFKAYQEADKTIQRDVINLLMDTDVELYRDFDSTMAQVLKFPSVTSQEKPKQHEQLTQTTQIEIPTLAEIEPQEKQWLIPGYLPRFDITLLAGAGGSGKSSIWVDIAACVSQGLPPDFIDPVLPNKDASKTVMYFSAEDSTRYVLHKRLSDRSANLNNIIPIDPTLDIFQKIKIANETLEQLLATYRPELVIFDPLQSFIDDRLHMSERNAMRSCLDPLAGMLERYRCTALICLHTNKRSDAYGRNRVADSSDLWDRARSVLITGQTEKPGLYYMSHEKCNYGKLSPTILYEIGDTGIQYKGITDKKDYDFVRESSLKTKKYSALDEAKDFVREYLSRGEMPVQELNSAAEGIGISTQTLKRAKAALVKDGVISQRQTVIGKGGNKKWYVSLSK